MSAKTSCGMSCVSNRHGDMIYLAEKSSRVSEQEVGSAAVAREVREHEVDKILAAKDGKIQRKRDPQLCAMWSTQHILPLLHAIPPHTGATMGQRPGA